MICNSEWEVERKFMPIHNHELLTLGEPQNFPQMISLIFIDLKPLIFITPPYKCPSLISIAKSKGRSVKRVEKQGRI